VVSHVPYHGPECFFSPLSLPLQKRITFYRPQHIYLSVLPPPPPDRHSATVPFFLKARSIRPWTPAANPFPFPSRLYRDAVCDEAFFLSDHSPDLPLRMVSMMLWDAPPLRPLSRTRNSEGYFPIEPSGMETAPF